MGKAHESSKATKKQPAMTAKEKRAAKHAKKHHVPGSPPFMGHHHQS